MRADLSRRAAHAFCALKLSWGERAADGRSWLNDVHTAAPRQWSGQISSWGKYTVAFVSLPASFANQGIVSVCWSEQRRLWGFYEPESGSNRDDSDHLTQPHICATVRTEGKVGFLCKCVVSEPPLPWRVIRVWFEWRSALFLQLTSMLQRHVRPSLSKAAREDLSATCSE